MGLFCMTHHWVISREEPTTMCPYCERDRLRKLQAWQPIDTAPLDTDVLMFGSYVYEGDKVRTEYMNVACRTNDPNWPFEDQEGQHPPDFYSHWMPLPEPPKGGDAT